MYFQNYGLPKTWLDQGLKSPVSEDPTKSNMVNAPKIVQISQAPSLPYLLITGKSIIVSQKVSVSDMLNLKTLS